MLVLIRDTPVHKGKQIFKDANDILSSFPMAKQERREPTEEEKKKRKKNSGGYQMKTDNPVQ